jgi:hypothetical protein
LHPELLDRVTKVVADNQHVENATAIHLEKLAERPAGGAVAKLPKDVR